MNLDIKNLYGTWFAELNLTSIGIPIHRTPNDGRGYKPWRCVCDEGNRFLVTQLISTTNEMREGKYYYCLLINDNAYTFENLSSGKFLAQGSFSIERMSNEEIQSLLSVAVQMLLDDAKKS